MSEEQKLVFQYEENCATHDAFIYESNDIYKFGTKLDISTEKHLPVEQFCEKYYLRQYPVILMEGMRSWKAIKKWSPQYIKYVSQLSVPIK